MEDMKRVCEVVFVFTSWTIEIDERHLLGSFPDHKTSVVCVPLNKVQRSFRSQTSVMEDLNKSGENGLVFRE